MNSLILPLCDATVYWLSNKRALTYRMRANGLFSLILMPIAWMRWVFPTPVGPKTNNGLNVLHFGSLAIASPIALAILLEVEPQ